MPQDIYRYKSPKTGKEYEYQWDKPEPPTPNDFKALEKQVADEELKASVPRFERGRVIDERDTTIGPVKTEMSPEERGIFEPSVAKARREIKSQSVPYALTGGIKDQVRRESEKLGLPPEVPSPGKSHGKFIDTLYNIPGQMVEGGKDFLSSMFESTPIVEAGRGIQRLGENPSDEALEKQRAAVRAFDEALKSPIKTGIRSAVDTFDPTGMALGEYDLAHGAIQDFSSGRIGQGIVKAGLFGLPALGAHYGLRSAGKAEAAAATKAAAIERANLVKAQAEAPIATVAAPTAGHPSPNIGPRRGQFGSQPGQFGLDPTNLTGEPIKYETITLSNGKKIRRPVIPEKIDTTFEQAGLAPDSLRPPSTNATVFNALLPDQLKKVVTARELPAGPYAEEIKVPGGGKLPAVHPTKGGLPLVEKFPTTGTPGKGIVLEPKRQTIEPPPIDELLSELREAAPKVTIEENAQSTVRKQELSKVEKKKLSDKAFASQFDAQLYSGVKPPSLEELKRLGAKISPFADEGEKVKKLTYSEAFKKDKQTPHPATSRGFDESYDYSKLDKEIEVATDAESYLRNRLVDAERRGNKIDIAKYKEPAADAAELLRSLVSTKQSFSLNPELARKAGYTGEGYKLNTPEKTHADYVNERKTAEKAAVEERASRKITNEREQIEHDYDEKTYPESYVREGKFEQGRDPKYREKNISKAESIFDGYRKSVQLAKDGKINDAWDIWNSSSDGWKDLINIVSAGSKTWSTFNKLRKEAWDIIQKAEGDISDITKLHAGLKPDMEGLSKAVRENIEKIKDSTAKKMAIMLGHLDKEKAPDSAYKDIFSGVAAKHKLEEGKKWRDEVVEVINYRHKVAVKRLKEAGVQVPKIEASVPKVEPPPLREEVPTPKVESPEIEPFTGREEVSVSKPTKEREVKNIRGIVADYLNKVGRKVKYVPTEEPNPNLKPVNLNEPYGQLVDAIRKAEPQARAQAELTHQDRVAKVAAMNRVENTGLKGHFERLGILKGSADRIVTKPLKISIEPFIRNVYENKTLKDFEKVNAAEGLRKLKIGATLQNSEIRYLEKVFGSGFGDEIRNLYAGLPLNLPKFESFTDALNTAKALNSFGELSFAFRQGLGAIHTKPFWTSWDKAIKAGLSDEYYTYRNTLIETDPLYALAEKHNLAITDVTRFAAREDQFVSKFAEKIPVVGKLIKANHRAASTFLNEIRFQNFKALLRDADNLGLNPQHDAKLVKEIAEYVNVSTGRGSLGKFEAASGPLNAMFYSPRLISSRLKLINSMNPFTYKNSNKFIRHQYLKSVASIASTGAIANILGNMMGGETGWDPFSTDFLKTKFDNMRVDSWGGLQQFVVLANRMVAGVSSTITGKQYDLGASYGTPTRKDKVVDFFGNKLSPVGSMFWDWMQGSDYKGKPIEWKARVLESVVPLFVQDMYELGQEDPQLFPLFVPGFVGMGVQNLGESKTPLSKDLSEGVFGFIPPLKTGGRKSGPDFKVQSPKFVY